MLPDLPMSFPTLNRFLFYWQLERKYQTVNGECERTFAVAANFNRSYRHFYCDLISSSHQVSNDKNNEPRPGQVREHRKALSRGRTCVSVWDERRLIAALENT